MFKNYLKIAWRNLWRNKLYSTINIGGLALGLSICMLITLYVAHEYSFDRFHKNASRIFSVHSKVVFGGDTLNMPMFSYVTAPLVKRNDAAVTDFLRLRTQSKPVIIQNPQVESVRFSEKSLMYADANFFKFFSFKLLKGSAENVLDQPFTVVLSEDMARKYFGNKNPIGKTLELTTDSTYRLQVNGVMANSPTNTDIRADFIVSLSSLKIMPEAKPFMESQMVQGGAFKTYFAIKNPEDAMHVKRTMQTLAAKNQEGPKDEYVFTALPDSHLKMNFDDSGNTKYLQVFPFVAALILLLALVNYMSLSTARATLRAKEIGVRKVTGASRKTIAAQFYVESGLYTVLSFILAYVLSILLHPWFTGLLQLKIDTSFLYGPAMIGITAMMILITILIAGLYPSIVLSAFKPVETLSGKMSSKGSGVWVRKVFTSLQFTISVALIICGLVMQRQLYYLRHTETGANRENVLMVPVQNTMGSNYQAFRGDIQTLAGVNQVATAHYPMYKGYDIYFVQGQKKDEPISLPVFSVDENFISTLNIKWKYGPLNSSALIQPNKVVINEAAVNKLRLAGNPVGEKIEFGNDKYEVAGVVKDFNFQSLDVKIDALALFITPDTSNAWGLVGGCLLAKINPKTNLPTLIAQVKETYQKYDKSSPFDYQFMDDAYNAMFKAEDRLAGIFNLFIGLAIVIAGMGLLGLATFTAQQRTKEIGIRKVLGASVTQITTLLSKDFIKLVLLAIIVASPIAWYAMNKWLQNFAYRIDIEWWVFVLAGILAVLIALLTVSFQAIKAALANPVKSLRTE